MKIIIIFTILSIINVIFSTVRSLATINGGKMLASILNGGYFAFYNIVLIYSVADFSLWQKCLITFTCNVIGVFIVKLIEEKMQKEKLWKVEFTIDNEKINQQSLINELTANKISSNYIEIGRYTIFNCFCENKNKSEIVKNIVKKYNAKYFVTESKTL